MGFTITRDTIRRAIVALNRILIACIINFIGSFNASTSIINYKKIIFFFYYPLLAIEYKP